MADLNRFPQFTARVEDFDLHFVHVVGEAGGKRPLLLSHGWPGSHYEFWGAIEKLAFPRGFGGEAADAFDLVIPSLPGFGFSSKPTRPFGQRATARLFNTLMTEVLGYDRYLAQGGDWGAMVTSWLGLDHGAHARAIHLNMLGFRPARRPAGRGGDRLGAAPGRGDGHDGRLLPPAGLQAAVDRLAGRRQSGGPGRLDRRAVPRLVGPARRSPFDQVFTLDQLLTNVMIYVMTGSFTTGAWYYRGLVEEGGLRLQPGERCETPDRLRQLPRRAALPGAAAAPSPSAPTTSSAGPTCRAAATSRRWKSRTCSWTRSGPGRGRRTSGAKNPAPNPLWITSQIRRYRTYGPR